MKQILSTQIARINRHGFRVRNVPLDLRPFALERTALTSVDHGVGESATEPTVPNGMEPGLREAQINALRQSAIFSTDYYQAAYPDIVKAGIDPLTHYFDSGFKEGRRPSIFFDALWYCESNPDIDLTKVHPLFHYFAYGDFEGRDPSLLFDNKWYRKVNHLSTSVNALEHYLTNKESSLLSPNPFFDVEYYVHQNPDIKAATLDAFEHFILFGAFEGRNPSAEIQIVNFHPAPGRTSLDQHPFENFIKIRRAHVTLPSAVNQLEDMPLSSSEEANAEGIPIHPSPHFKRVITEIQSEALEERVRLQRIIAKKDSELERLGVASQSYIERPRVEAVLGELISLGKFRDEAARQDLLRWKRAFRSPRSDIRSKSDHTNIDPTANSLDRSRYKRGLEKAKLFSKSFEARSTLERETILEASDLFSEDYYASAAGLNTEEINLYAHYITVGSSQGIDPHPLFHSQFYRQRSMQKSDQRTPLEHWIEFGGASDTCHPLFDAKFYCRQYAEAIPPDVNAVDHFLSVGGEVGLDPHPLFSTAHYLEQLDGLRSPPNALIDYLTIGFRELRSPHPLFDPEFYQHHFPHGLNGRSHLEHYVLEGSLKREDPHPLFESKYYARITKIPPATVMSPLEFFLWHDESLSSPTSLFDPIYVIVTSDWRRDSVDPLLEYATSDGQAANPHPCFDVAFYRCQISTLKPLANNIVVDYVRRVPLSGDYDPHPGFSSRSYLDAFPDVAKRSMNPLRHYLSFGRFEHRSPVRFFDPEAYRSRYSIGREIDAYSHFIQYPFKIGLQNLVGIGAAGSAVKQDAPDPIKRHSQIGFRPANPDWPNVLLCAHVASNHLFGSERSFLDLVDALAHFNVNIFVTVPNNAPAYLEYLAKSSAEIWTFSYPWWRDRQICNEQVIDEFKKIINDNKISLVHVNTIMLREPLVAAKHCSVRSVLHVRELIELDSALISLIGESALDVIRSTTDMADFIIGNSNITAKMFDKGKDTYVVPNTVDCDAYSFENSLSSEEIRFGLLSSNVEKKGIKDLIKVAEVCEHRVPKAIFCIIGPETSIVKEIIELKRAGRYSNVRCLGYFDDPKKAIAQVNVVLNFSTFAESFGRTILEGMAAGRPAIVYDWGALNELVIHGRNGLLVAYGDFDGAVECVRLLCGNYNLIEAFGKAGREYARLNYSTVEYRKKLSKVYSDLLGKPIDEAENKSRWIDIDRTFGPVVRPARAAHPSLGYVPTPKNKCRIAYFCWHFPVPSETFVLSELEILLEDGFDVIVFCKESPHKDFHPPFDVQVEKVRSPEHLAQRLVQTGRSVVHAHFVFPTVTNMVWPACEIAKLPFTFMAHAQDIFRYDNDKLNRLSEIGASDWCLRGFTLSTFHRHYLIERGFPAKKIVINANAVDTRRFAAIAGQKGELRTTRKVIAIHRYVPKKGLHLIIEAAALLSDLNLSFEFYGYGACEQEYRTLIGQLGIKNVSINGRISQEEVVRILKDADLFVSPSVRVENGDMDGIPTSIVESMAAGLPVLATQVGGISDLVIDEITGLIATPTPQGVADAIRRFYGLPTSHVRSIIDTAKLRAIARHDAKHIVRVLSKVWQRKTTDILVVSWNNIRELTLVVDRILTNTSLPYHLIICDNNSQREPVPAFLEELWAKEDLVTIVHNDRNAMVGPGTNLALEQGNGDYAIYVCGREGVSFGSGWDIPYVRVFDENPNFGLIGSIGYSPSYLTGAEYPKGIPLFKKFRNKRFAGDKPKRTFGHVQGGLFGMRRSMVESIGGFSEAVPHDYTDVEYSFYAESKGWVLGEVPGTLALFNKSRPTVSQRFDEGVIVAHPVLAHEIPLFEGVYNGLLRHCNICDWYGDDFGASRLCPKCVSSPHDRTVFRWLSDGIFLHRRLPALAVGISGILGENWSMNFQGPRLGVMDFVSIVRDVGRLPNKNNGLAVGVLRLPALTHKEVTLIAKETYRLLSEDAPLLVQIMDVEDDLGIYADAVAAALTGVGFKGPETYRYASRAIAFCHDTLLKFTR